MIKRDDQLVVLGKMDDFSKNIVLLQPEQEPQRGDMSVTQGVSPVKENRKPVLVGFLLRSNAKIMTKQKTSKNINIR